MIKYFQSLIVVFIILFSSCSNLQSQKTFISLSAKAFAEKVKQLSNAVILDVRTPQEFSKDHLINSKNIDWNENNFETEIEKLDKSKPVFVYCLSGGRSTAAAELMHKKGFKEIYEMDGGIMKWRAANLPETTNTATQTAALTKAQFNALTNNKNKMVLVDFYADWCGPCKKMEPYLKEIATTMVDKVVLVRINADDNQELCKELNIDALPVLHLYKNNSLAWKNLGYISKEDVLKKLE
ncbi:MAG: thioredoxin fold domain-containing protein [Bacteroidetes bacterium]|nr:thioredoxin fold domain-containing protein [Bacteroidota bacterium]MBS1671358.1 thioredoxin fold domain-containing protein [Bacteroidota bacterium]